MKKIINIFAALLFVFCTQASIYSADEKAVPFELKGPDGDIYKFEAGSGITVFNFFATWCDSCEEEIPMLAELKNKNPNAVYIGINAGESVSKVQKFVKKHAYPWRVIMDENKDVAKKYGIVGLPTTVIIKDGKITFRGSRPPKTL